MLKNLIRISKSLIYVIFLIIFIYINNSPLETYGKIFNQSKENDFNSFLKKEEKDLVILTVTGDQRYKNANLQKLYKDLQIIHVLIISASNILLLLNFIHIFIYRKNKTSYFVTLIFIYLYGRLISFPETFLRSIQTIAVNQINNNLGLKFSKIRQITILVFIYLLTFNLGKLGDSYKLSSIYSTIIMISTTLSKKIFRSKALEFFFLASNLTITSSIIFNLTHYSSICTTFIANIFITITYDFAIYLSYITYLVPNFLLITEMKIMISNLLSYILMSLIILTKLTYNICNESFTKSFF